MRKAVLLALFSLGFISCVSVKNLPQNPSPYISKIDLVKGVKQEGERIVPVPFKGKIGENPVIFLILKNAEGKNRVKFRLYTGKTLTEEYEISFGKPGEYYSRVILWQGLKARKKGTYILAIFLNESLLAIKKFRIEGLRQGP